MKLKEGLAWLVDLGGLGLVVAGFNFGMSAVLGFDFLSQTPEFVQMITGIGAFVGGVDTLSWIGFDRGLVETE